MFFRITVQILLLFVSKLHKNLPISYTGAGQKMCKRFVSPNHVKYLSSSGLDIFWKYTLLQFASSGKGSY